MKGTSKKDELDRKVACAADYMTSNVQCSTMSSFSEMALTQFDTKIKLYVVRRAVTTIYICHIRILHMLHELTTNVCKSYERSHLYGKENLQLPQLQGGPPLKNISLCCKRGPGAHHLKTSPYSRLVGGPTT